MKKYIRFIILGTLIVISILFLLNSVSMLFKQRYILYVNHKNRSEVYTIISSSIKNVKQDLYKIEYFQGLGEGNLYLYYKNAKKDEILLNEHDGIEIKNYIKENGWSNTMLGIIYFICSSIVIIFCTVYGIFYSMNYIVKNDIK